MRIVNLYPPYLGAGIRVVHRKGDERTIVVAMPLRPYNRNLFGTHFGGSLYSMCDPWFVFLLLRLLGDGYVVWDKAASIDFVRPGRGRVTATFRVTPEEEAAIRDEVERQGRSEPILTAEVVGEEGEVVARVTKRLWVRKARPRGTEGRKGGTRGEPAGDDGDGPGR